MLPSATACNIPIIFFIFALLKGGGGIHHHNLYANGPTVKLEKNVRPITGSSANQSKLTLKELVLICIVNYLR